MNPTLSNISEEGDVYKFTLSQLNVSLANAIRRTIISDIPTTVIYTDTSSVGQCNISVNTTRLHNEILKQRLSCIPIHIDDLTTLASSLKINTKYMMSEKNKSKLNTVPTTSK